MIVADRKKITATVQDAVEKAGTLVTAALGIALAALAVAAAALVIAVKVRHAST